MASAPTGTAERSAPASLGYLERVLQGGYGGGVVPYPCLPGRSLTHSYRLSPWLCFVARRRARFGALESAPRRASRSFVFLRAESLSFRERGLRRTLSDSRILSE